MTTNLRFHLLPFMVEKPVISDCYIIYGKRRRKGEWSFPSFQADLKYIIITALRQNQPVRNWSASKISTVRKEAVLEDEPSFLSSHCRKDPSVEEMSISATSELSAEPDHFPGVGTSSSSSSVFSPASMFFSPCILNLHTTWIMGQVKWKGSPRVLARWMAAIVQKARGLMMIQTCCGCSKGHE